MTHRKLTPEQKKKIRKSAATDAKLAKRYRVPQWRIRRIRSDWKEGAC